MQWINLTTAALYDAKAAQLILAVQSTCLNSGQGDPVPNLISQVSEEIRGAIGFNAKYNVSATLGSIPPNLKELAVQKIIRVCKRRLEQTLDQADRDDEATYQKKLSGLIAGTQPVDQPDDPLAISPSTPFGKVTSITAPPRHFTRCDLQNL